MLLLFEYLNKLETKIPNKNTIFVFIFVKVKQQQPWLFKKQQLLFPKGTTMINKILVSNNLEEANQFKESVAKRALKLLMKKECFEDVKNNRF